MTAPDACPHCHTSLQGDPIPEQHLKAGMYGDWDGEPRYYSRVIGTVMPRVYDGVLFFTCPDCDGRWHRWPEGTWQHHRAKEYVR